MKNNENIMLSVGDIIVDNKINKKYRIVAIVNDGVTLCEMEIQSLNLSVINKITLFELISNKELYVVKETNIVFDKENLSKEMKEKFELKKRMMNEVLSFYAPTYIGLAGKKPKEKVKEIIKKYNYPKSTFWRTIAIYFQSGLQDYSLVDGKHFGNTSGKILNHKTKAGRPSEYLDITGVILTDEVRSYFEEALKDYKSGRHKTFKSAFDKMNLLHFTKTEIINGIPTIVLMSESERPTFRQFSYYMSKHLTKQEKDLVKTSAMEQKNNKRLIVSDTLFGVKGPGDMVEIDACEADISLVSVIDPSKTVGRPIVYFMIDVYSRIILAMSVAFDNNSIMGLTNLFLNLADDKQEYCKKYGITYDNPQIWPSNIIPNNVRVDRGAEFRGKEFERICEELGMNRILVAPGSGSLKGVVEQSFHQLHNKQNVHIEKHGLIEKRHDSHHHQTAMLNIEEYTKMVIGFVLTHNQQCLTTYPLTKDMITQRIKPIPALLWEYGIKNCYVPRPIPSKEQYLFNLMTPIKAKVNRRGICYKELWYLNTEDRLLAREMFDAGNKRVSFEARIDMRDVGAIYYLRDNKLMVAKLNSLLNGNADYSGLTMKQYEEYLKGKKELLAEGRLNNEELSAFTYAMNNNIVVEAQKPALPDAKNMRPVRAREKQEKVKANKISKRLETNQNEMVEEFLEIVEPIEVVETVEPVEIAEIVEQVIEEKEDKKKTVPLTYKSWDEALEDW